MPIRVGTDLVAVDWVRESIRAHAGRYLERIYTEDELADCLSADGIAVERLAARFAAKEATLKVLRPGPADAVPWRSIGLRRHPSGWTAIELSGRAGELAAAAGVDGLAVSVAHEGEYAAATVVATLGAEL
jgi:holo-[acyl-carrier protein] synthase